MTGPGERLARLRRRRPVVDHAVRMVEHNGSVKGNQQAGAVTYFGFLSFFPILALAFFTIGYVTEVFPDAQEALLDAIDEVLPGLVGDGENEVSLEQVQDAAGAVGLIGLAGVLYSGLGWLSAMRDALITVFELPERLRPNFVVGKLRDLVTLALIGVVLLVSVAIAGVITGFSEDLLGWLGLADDLGWLLRVVSVAIGLVANTALFYAMFRLLADPPVPRRALLSGAVLGAVGFELLKQLSSLLLASTKGQPAFQAFGIALILLVWINYFSRVVMYAAAWAHTAPLARASRPAPGPAPVQGPRTPPLTGPGPVAPTPAPAWVGPFAGGAAAMLALVAVLRKRTSRSRS